MSEDNMPAAEAEVVVDDALEPNHYELAFHVLPTVAEGEVSSVFDALKSSITGLGATVTMEEAPERFDLAYEIQEMIEGKYRKFSSAYFGWVRFTLTADQIETLNEMLASNSNLLRHLLIKLTKLEEAHPFRFHEALKSEKMVTTVEESAVVPDLTTADHAGESSEAKKEDDTKEAGTVSEAALDESLDKITGSEEEKATEEADESKA